MNVAFFAMEIKFLLSGKLNMAAAATGEVITGIEVELFFAIILWACAYFGNAGIHNTTLGDTLGIPPGSKCPLHYICEFKYDFFIGLSLALL